MDVFDNCRICLHQINYEPIKMTRLILKFLENSLQLTNVAKPNSQDNVKQNLCAPCFNLLSQFQEFLEQCKDSDEFWRAQFDDLKEMSSQKQLTLDETILLPLEENSSSLEADTTVSTTELKNDIYTQSKEESYGSALSPEYGIDQDMHRKEEELLQTCQENQEETSQIVGFKSINLNWPNESNEYNGEIQIIARSVCNENTNQVSDEIIEYEYQIEEVDEDEIEESRTNESTNTNTCDIDYRSFSYEKIETEKPITTDKLQENIEESTGTIQNSFFTSIDENGKVKTIYKCQHCEKTFNRIYDIESHYNIHNDVKPFTCHVCGKSFRQKNILTTHQVLHFGKKVECVECGKKFARRSQLILHYRMHRDEKPFVCNIDGCQAAFRQRKQLIDHSFIHTGEKNFQCVTCTKSFLTRKRLQDHIYKVHSQYRYRCELCEKDFLKPHLLKQHMIAAHNIEVDDVSHLKTLVDVAKPIRKIITN